MALAPDGLTADVTKEQLQADSVEKVGHQKLPDHRPVKSASGHLSRKWRFQCRTRTFQLRKPWPTFSTESAQNGSSGTVAFAKDNHYECELSTDTGNEL